jgi:hypothetical protein
MADTGPRYPARRWSPTVAATLAAWGPPVLAAALLAIGFWWRLPGTGHPADYHDYSFRALNYSDIIWLYLRDRTATHPRPYLDYPLEYPPLTGALIYLLGFAAGPRAYYCATYGVLALGALGAVLALGRLPGANPWFLAAAPALWLTGGLNWDLAAIGMTAAALLAYARGRDGRGTLALLAAVWLKFFPLVFLVAVVAERWRAARLRAARRIAGGFALGSAALHLPLVVANRAGWSYFFTFNSARPAEPGLWTVLGGLDTAQVNRLSAVALGAGCLVGAWCAVRSRRPVLLPLGSALLLWWLFLNKVYSPQYGLWVLLALALAPVPALLWQAVALADGAYFVVSFQLLYAGRFQRAELSDWLLRYLHTPLVLARLALLLACLGWLVAAGMTPVVPTTQDERP